MSAYSSNAPCKGVYNFNLRAGHWSHELGAASPFGVHIHDASNSDKEITGKDVRDVLTAATLPTRLPFAAAAERVSELRKRVEVGEAKARLAREFGVTRATIYNVLA